MTTGETTYAGKKRAAAAALAVALAAALALCPGAAFAWSANGHKTVARIAADLLAAQAQGGDAAASQALSGIRRLLPGVTLDQVAPCPDQIRRDGGTDCAGITLPAMPQSQPWHFVDIPISDSPSSLDAYCSGGNCVVSQIDADVAELQSPQGRFSSDATLDQQLALIFLVHFVGDEHQPLHCAEEDLNGVSDYGGNKKAVTWAAGGAAVETRPSKAPVQDPGALEPSDSLFGLNLHALWDHLIAPSDSADPAALSQRLEQDLKGQDSSAWLSGDFVASAALESFAVAQSQIYPAYHAAGGSRITADYVSRMQPVAYRRLEMAGVRLAELLRRSFAGPSLSGNVAQASAPRRSRRPRAETALASAAAVAQALAGQ